MTKMIIGIHGLANKPAEPIQDQGWKDSINEGLSNVCKEPVVIPNNQFEAIYWADLMYKYPLHNDLNFTFDNLYDDEPYYQADAAALQSYQDGLKDRILADASNVVGNLLDGVKKTFGADDVADFILKKALKDLDFYYDEKRQIQNKHKQLCSAKHALQDTLKEVLLKHKDKEIMLIAHSMGTIIAYDVLRNLEQESPSFKIAHFVTIGSPLGLPHVKYRATNEGKTIPRTPENVTQSWKNFADRKDPVAFDTHLHDDYQKNQAKVVVQDELILNDYCYKGKANHHKLFGYLRAPELSEHIRDFLNK